VRTGQYAVFFRNLFQDLRLENVVVFTLMFRQFLQRAGTDFSKNMWWGIAAADYLKDIHTSLRGLRHGPRKRPAQIRQLWETSSSGRA
jgi:predicted nucleotide-binding protein (sugar kinase/HSP70/actin superfamily)